MSDHILLMGSEDVSRAGSNIAQAATEISRAAGTFDNVVDRLVQAMREHAERIEAAAEKLQPPEFSAAPIISYPHVYTAIGEYLDNMAAAVGLTRLKTDEQLREELLHWVKNK